MYFPKVHCFIAVLLQQTLYTHLGYTMCTGNGCTVQLKPITDAIGITTTECPY